MLMQDKINIKPNKSYENLKKISAVLNAIACIVATLALFALQCSILMMLTNGAGSLSPYGSVEELFFSIVTIGVMSLPLGLAAKISAYLIKIYLLGKNVIDSTKADKVLTIIYLSIFCVFYYIYCFQYLFLSHPGV